MSLLHKWRWVAAMLALHVVILARGACIHFPNVDEVAHLPAGVSHWLFAEFDLYQVSPPLVQMVAGAPPAVLGSEYDWRFNSETPGKRPEFTIGFRRLSQVKLKLRDEFILPRWFCIPFSLLGVVILVAWVNQLFGRLSAHCICALWCFCPNILAHAQTIIPDVGSVAMGLWAAYNFWSYLQTPSLAQAAWSGFFLGLAMLTKLTWLTAVVSFPLATLLCVVLFPALRCSARRWRIRCLDLLCCYLVALFVLNAGYLFEDSMTPLGEFQFCSEALGGPGASRNVHKNRFVGAWLASVPVPAPKNYLQGIDFLRHEVEAKYWSFLMGEWRLGSWPHYYVMTTLLKTPEPTLLGALIGVAVLLMGTLRKLVEPKVAAMFLMLGIPASVCFVSISLQGGFNHHHRYVLMIYSVIFALTAFIASPTAVEMLRFRLPFLGSKKRSIAVSLAVTLVVLSATSSLRVHPYYTSYFNSLSGGPENGWRLLGFSNIDWGQDLLDVDKWIKEHPDCRPLALELDYYNVNDSDLFGLPRLSPPKLPKGASIDEARKSIKETQWWIVSVTTLYNYPGANGLEYLQQLKPVDKIAYAYHVYRIAPMAPTDRH